MYLNKLSANMMGFHTIKFKDGLNFIVGRRENLAMKDLKETYNGLGKSLTIEIIHFCLGSNKTDAFKENLQGWIFTLEFTIKGEKYVVSRSCDEQNNVILNGEKTSLKKYNKIMQEKVFDLNDDKKIDYLTFRSLISRFIRRYKSSYNKYDIYVSQETDYQKLINNGYLLGLSAELIQNKMKLKKEIEQLGSTKKTVEKDAVLKEYFVGNEDLDIQITDLKDEIKEVENKIRSFKVAENYKDMKLKADGIAHEKKEILNRLVIIENSIRKIDKSLKIKSDIQLESILQVYKEAQVVFEDKVVKNLEQVTEFHNKLLQNRQQRLENQKNSMINERLSLEQKAQEYGNELDKLMYFLGSHGALEEYTAINDRLSELKLRLEKATDYKNLLETYENKLAEANIEIEKQKLQANKYIKENEELFENIMSVFRTYSKTFYKDKASGLDIKVNDGANQLRFDINAKIIGDSSDGISEVCIFCFDLTLLKLGNHNVNFLFHDSRLFANMDPRQRLSLIKIVEDEAKKCNIQYIASLNEDLISTLKDVAPEEEYNHYSKLIEDNTILSLTDKCDEDKLLGMTIDIPYDK
ncbi:DUF2326 domain-containing protein [Clostridium butyricum]|uniref:DUF2326 domain-containing protein n=2 Tax=root TaxID=1 RepID=A0A2S7FFY5_CLOBU|nr:DUF2326 domain-containing protein [Clostridium butyricum]KHD17167.1 hypothetical protein OA81_02010 [Clostridium butyricum]PPV17942.1 hypothetical protein AWN73_00615 [Clostridium butyricum]